MRDVVTFLKTHTLPKPVWGALTEDRAVEMARHDIPDAEIDDVLVRRYSPTKRGDHPLDKYRTRVCKDGNLDGCEFRCIVKRTRAERARVKTLIKRFEGESK